MHKAYQDWTLKVLSLLDMRLIKGRVQTIEVANPTKIALLARLPRVEVEYGFRITITVFFADVAQLVERLTCNQ